MHCLLSSSLPFDAGSDAGFTEILNPSAFQVCNLGKEYPVAMSFSLAVLVSFVQSPWLDWDRYLSPLHFTVFQGHMPHA
jgi:hypothetical protein